MWLSYDTYSVAVAWWWRPRKMKTVTWLSPAEPRAPGVRRDGSGDEGKCCWWLKASDIIRRAGVLLTTLLACLDDYWFSDGGRPLSDGGGPGDERKTCRLTNWACGPTNVIRPGGNWRKAVTTPGPSLAWLWPRHPTWPYCDPRPCDWRDVFVKERDIEMTTWWPTAFPAGVTRLTRCQASGIQAWRDTGGTHEWRSGPGVVLTEPDRCWWRAMTDNTLTVGLTSNRDPVCVTIINRRMTWPWRRLMMMAE